MWTLKINHSGPLVRGISRAAVIASVIGAICAGLAPSGRGAASTVPGGDFAKVTSAFFDKHCVECHGDKVQKGELNLQSLKSPASLLKERKLWVSVLNQVRSEERRVGTECVP